MTDHRPGALRGRIDELNPDLLPLLQEPAGVVLEIARIKQELGIEGFDPLREDEMLTKLSAAAVGPFGPQEVRHVFGAIFRTSLGIQEHDRHSSMRVRRKDLLPDGGVRVGPYLVGGATPVLMAGPCAVESKEQVDRIAERLASFGLQTLLRGGAYKPRTSPYAFQGLREEGLKILREAGDRYGLPVVTEVLDVATLPIVTEYADMLQVGARNMYNTELLKALGKCGKPVLLKRGFMA